MLCVSEINDVVVPKGAPLPGQYEIFGREIMNEMKKKHLLESSFTKGREISHFGRMKPVESFRPRDVLIHDWVHERVAAATLLQAHMLVAKKTDFEEFDLIQELILEEFGARISGTRGGGEFETLDGLMKVQVTNCDQKYVGSAITAAEELVREVMDDLMNGTSSDLQQIVDRAFVRNRITGKISTTRIAGLVNLDISHPKWPAAQAALRDALRSGGTRRYMRFYQRAKPTDQWTLIDLNYSSLEG